MRLKNTLVKPRELTTNHKEWISKLKFRNRTELKELYALVSGEIEQSRWYTYTIKDDGSRILTSRLQPDLPDLSLTLASECRFLDSLDNTFGGDTGVMG